MLGYFGFVPLIAKVGLTGLELLVAALQAYDWHQCWNHRDA